MAKRRSVWIEDEDLDRCFSINGTGYCEAFEDRSSDTDREFREILPDDGWQPWEVAKEWQDSQLVTVHDRREGEFLISSVGSVRHIDSICQWCSFQKLELPQ